MKKVKELTDLLFNLRKKQKTLVLESKNRELLAEADCIEMAVAQQNLLAAGVDLNDLWMLWKNNRNVLPDQADKMRKKLPDNHILRKILAEHEMLLCFVADLEDVNDEIQNLEEGSSVTSEVRELGHIMSHLLAAEQHRELEEQMLFPELERQGYYGPSKVIRTHHNNIRLANLRLNEVIWSVDDIKFEHFKIQLDQLVQFLVPTLRKHLFIENNILFPLAMEFIHEKKSWDRLKRVSSNIGYCSFCHSHI